MKLKFILCLALVVCGIYFRCSTAARPSLTVFEKQYVTDQNDKLIQSMGLVKRARHDFFTKLPDATITQFRINFVATTNTVWCTAGYRLSKRTDIFQKDFAYQYNGGTNWILVWNIGQ